MVCLSTLALAELDVTEPGPVRRTGGFGANFLDDLSGMYVSQSDGEERGGELTNDRARNNL